MMWAQPDSISWALPYARLAVDKQGNNLMEPVSCQLTGCHFLVILGVWKIAVLTKWAYSSVHSPAPDALPSQLGGMLRLCMWVPWPWRREERMVSVSSAIPGSFIDRWDEVNRQLLLLYFILSTGRGPFGCSYVVYVSVYFFLKRCLIGSNN